MALRTADKLVAEQTALKDLLASETSQWTVIADQIKDMKASFVKADPRKTVLAEAPQIDFDPTEILVEREPITVICSEKGWIGMRGIRT